MAATIVLYQGRFVTNALIHGDVHIRLPVDPDTFRGEMDFLLSMDYKGFYHPPGGRSVSRRMRGIFSEFGADCRTVDNQEMGIFINLRRGTSSHQYTTDKPVSSGVLVELRRVA